MTKSISWFGVPVSVFLTLLVLLPGTPALAQRTDNEAVAQRIERLEKDLRDLSREVYRGGGRSSGDSGGSALPPGVAGDFEVRLQRLESELQQLTNRYEEATHNVGLLRDRLDKLGGDVDFRLQRLEQAESGSLTPPPEAAPGAGPSPAAGGPKDRSGRPDAGGSASSSSADPLPSGPAPTGTAQQQYDAAFNLIRLADYANAETAFASFLKQFPKDALSGNAQYWLAETLYVRNKFKEAAVAFADGYQKYPKGSKAPDSLLKLSMSLGNLNRREDACIALQTLLAEYKTAPQTILRRAENEKTRQKCA